MNRKNLPPADRQALTESEIRLLRARVADLEAIAKYAASQENPNELLAGVRMIIDAAPRLLESTFEASKGFPALGNEPFNLDPEELAREWGTR